MSDTLLLLNLEHRHAEHLLRLIEQQVALGDDCDLDVLDSIAAYFLDYPDRCHHPVEDTVFRRLQLRDPDGAARLGKVLEEHVLIARMSRAFAGLVEKARRDGSVIHNRLPAETDQFVGRYRKHMRTEETTFFPLAEEALTADDWAEIDYELFDARDPLFDREVEGRFRALREKIDAAAALSLRRAAALRRGRVLRELDDIAGFNRLMTDAGQRWRLVTRTGGYSLVHGDQVVIDLPDCSEARAAWCAWFFVQPGGTRAVAGAGLN